MHFVRTRAALITGALLLVSAGISGCQKESQGGDTVPAPPRELIEKSYRGGNMGDPPPPQPGATKR